MWGERETLLEKGCPSPRTPHLSQDFQLVGRAAQKEFVPAGVGKGISPAVDMDGTHPFSRYVEKRPLAVCR